MQSTGGSSLGPNLQELSEKWETVTTKNKNAKAFFVLDKNGVVSVREKPYLITRILHAIGNKLGLVSTNYNFIDCVSNLDNIIKNCTAIKINRDDIVKTASFLKEVESAASKYYCENKEKKEKEAFADSAKALFNDARSVLKIIKPLSDGSVKRKERCLAIFNEVAQEKMYEPLYRSDREDKLVEEFKNLFEEPDEYLETVLNQKWFCKEPFDKEKELSLWCNKHRHILSKPCNALSIKSLQHMKP